MASGFTRTRQHKRPEMPDLPLRPKGGVREVTLAPFVSGTSYPIDDFANCIPWRKEFLDVSGDLAAEQAVTQLRFLVAQAGDYALERAHADRDDALRRAQAKAHLKALGELAARARLIAKRDVEPFNHHFAQFPSVDDGTHPEIEIEMISDAHDDAACALHRLSEITGELASAIDEFKLQFPLGKAFNPGNRFPLEHRFVEGMHIYYHALTGLDPEANRSGAYARLLAAAWKSLGFPDLGADADMVETLGRLHSAQVTAQKKVKAS